MVEFGEFGGEGGLRWGGRGRRGWRGCGLLGREGLVKWKGAF